MEMARSSINNTCIDTAFDTLAGVDVQAKEFDLDRLIRCRCLTSTLVALNLVHGGYPPVDELL